MTKPPQRIVSFLPAATEMIYALGLADRLVGVTHECDFPKAAQEKPVVVRSILPVEAMSQADIDVAVSAQLREGQSLYEVDEALMRELAPDLIVTQDLCQVRAPSGNEVTKVLASLDPKPEILFLTPQSLGGVFDNIKSLGAVAEVAPKADALVSSLRSRLDVVTRRARVAQSRPRVFCMEWLDPVYCSGHWMAQMIRIAGGDDALSRDGSDSVRIPWQDVLGWAPEILVIAPCGFHLEDTAKAAETLFARPGWADIPAVRNGCVYAVDASSYFARPGPRVVEGTELLAHLIHPELFNWNGPRDAFRKIAGVERPALQASAP
jgi:iron complex transport system substrate-binding protein